VRLTALAIIPHSLSIFAAAVLVSGLYDRLTLRNIARLGFVVVAAGLMLLAVMIRNEWDTLPVILALTLIGLGQGALVTVLFNALAAGAGRRCGLAARHHQQSRRGCGHGDRRHAPDRAC